MYILYAYLMNTVHELYISIQLGASCVSNTNMLSKTQYGTVQQTSEKCGM